MTTKMTYEEMVANVNAFQSAIAEIKALQTPGTPEYIEAQFWKRTQAQAARRASKQYFTSDYIPVPNINWPANPTVTECEPPWQDIETYNHDLWGAETVMFRANGYKPTRGSFGIEDEDLEGNVWGAYHTDGWTVLEFTPEQWRPLMVSER